MAMGPNKELGTPALPVLSFRSAIPRITDTILASSRQRAFIIRDRCLVGMVHQMCPIYRINNRLRLYGSNSSNQFPEAANGFRIPRDEHRDSNQVIFQYMKRVKLFFDL